MPKKINETRQRFDSVEALRDYAHDLDTAIPVPLDARGKPTRFVGIENSRTGEVVASMSKRYGIAQHKTVLLSALDSLAARNVPLQSAVISQSDTRLHARLVFEQAIRVGKDESPQNLGAVVRNSLDGSTNVESSLFLFRSWCENGNIFGREDITGGAHKHTLGVEARVLAGFASYFGNYGQVLLPWQKALEAAQTMSYDEAQLTEALKHTGLGERMAEMAGNHLSKYVQEQGPTAYAAYQSATHVIAHSGKVGSFNSEDRLQAAANRLLTVQPYEAAWSALKEKAAKLATFVPPTPVV